MDLLIRNARLADRPSDEPVDIGVGNGRIVAIARGLVADAQVYDAEGRLVCPGLIESHIHLDKSRIIDRCAPQERATLSPVKGVTPLKASMTVEDVYKRAAQTLEQCIVHGTTRVRTQVEVDPGIGMRGFDAVQALIADYKWAVDIEMCVFPQEGLTNYPGTDELLVEGLKRGAKLIGGAPRYDSDAAAQIERIFALAREFDVDIDMHLDVGHTPDAMNVHLVRELTEKYKRGGRVVVGHMAKLSLLPPEQVRALCTSPGGCRHRRHGAAGNRPLPDGARPGAQRAAGRGGRQSADRAGRELLAFLQQYSQSGDALRRLLADPHGEPLRQRPPARSPR
jgi:cytosine deaminase